eukprot:TRINITY_DN8085_c0_g1_i2.p1 TRINITY_DN8085_c0_g1~~TRINITY_DN8085_c0_g1_i2.p1  ORF type:complete len:158 (-),score=22.32 TRINITY_DN8085_c0_g1_i2:28-501(-)
MPHGPFRTEAEFRDYLESLQRNSSLVPFVVVDKASSKRIGIITFLNIVPANRSIEIGNIWYGKDWQKTYANTEACLLTLRYCFNELEYRRFEWKCNAENEKSKAAALGLGFTYEGTFRQHMIVKGKNRDTTWFSIIDKEWKMVEEKLENRLKKHAQK